MNVRMTWLSIMILGLLASPVIVHAENAGQLGEFIPYVLDSGKTQNATSDTSIVYDEVITIANAAWWRLHFTLVDLSPGSYVRVTSEADGAVQVLDADTMSEWGLTSAYFNGDTMHVELIAAAGASGDQIVLDAFEAFLWLGGSEPCFDRDDGICEGDDRVPSQALWSARMLPSNCTASIYNAESCAVTAGHCAFDASDIYVLQFNVPPSDESCVLNHPAPSHQFPVTDFRSRGLEGETLGYWEDWAVLRVGANHLGQTPYERYGEFRPLATSPASTTDLVELWSYGKDIDTPTMNQVQQYSSGILLFVDDLGMPSYKHNADIIVGSSGGAVIHDGEIIGIQANASSAELCVNPATRIDYPPFVAAREALCGEGMPVEKKSWGALKAGYR